MISVQKNLRRFVLYDESLTLRLKYVWVEKYCRLPARGECLTDQAVSKDGCQGLTEAFTARPRHPSHSLL